MKEGKKIFFASDFHLGVNGAKTSKEREQQIVRWLTYIEPQVAELYLVGDVFDFWFEYKRVVPKGYVRLLGKLAQMRDAGIPIYFFTGNHDMWMFRYLQEELDIPIYREPIQRTIAGKRFLIGHGDGLGPGDHGYKFIKKVFASPVSQWFYERLHPNFGIAFANFWSATSRKSNKEAPVFEDPSKEWLLTYANERLDDIAIDYFIFGHRHLAIDYTLKNGRSRYINLGEWLYNNSYAVFDGQTVRLQCFENPDGIIYSDR